MSGNRLRRALTVALSSVGLVLILAAPASAAPQVPGIPDCKDAPVAQMPGVGLPGFLDEGPTKPPAPLDPFVAKPQSSVYEQYGYAGLSWHTYDLGCGGSVRDTDATLDTTVGNAFLSGAVWTTSAANGLHNKVSRPAEYMAPLDDVVATVTQRLNDSIWNPWGGAMYSAGWLTLLCRPLAAEVVQTAPDRKALPTVVSRVASVSRTLPPQPRS